MSLPLLTLVYLTFLLIPLSAIILMTIKQLLIILNQIFFNQTILVLFPFLEIFNNFVSI